MSKSFHLAAFAFLVVALVGAQDAPPGTGHGAAEPTYDPLRVKGADDVRAIDLDVHDDARERHVPIRVFLDETDGARPVVLFSHGLGGSREGSAFLGRHWAARGYAAVFLQHSGSDEGVWKDVAPRERMRAMERAASLENLLLRVGDVGATLDALAAWNEEEQSALFGRLDLAHVGMAGHSFGAVTTQSVAGQAAGRLGQRWIDERIDAALVLSPSMPRAGDADTAFASVRVPWMLMTGTEDSAPIGGQTPASRLEVWPRLPTTIDRYELVLDGAEHSAFTERALPGDTRERNPNHHRSIEALSTAFWDAHLRGDADARAWLHGEGARSVLEPDDVWRCAGKGEQEAR